MNELNIISLDSMNEGKRINLDNYIYGSHPPSGKFLKDIPTYYHFLAGFVKSQNIKTFLEIGIHYGGFIFALSEGLTSKNKNYFLTIDIKDWGNNKEFQKYGHIKRIIGDYLSRDVIKQVINFYISKSLDLMFIDSIHDYKSVKQNINVYGKKLNPNYIILDDMHLNHSMEKLWLELKNKYKERIFDASKITRRDCELGLIKWKE